MDTLDTRFPSDGIASIEGPEFNVPPKTLIEAFEEAAALAPEREALIYPGVFGDKRYTYRQVSEMIDQVAAGFQARGLKPGDKAAFFMPNSPYYAIMALGVLKAGGVIANIQLSSKEERAQHPERVVRRVHETLRELEPDYLVTLDVLDFKKLCRQACEGTGVAALISCPMKNLLQPLDAFLFPLRKMEYALQGGCRQLKKNLRELDEKTGALTRRGASGFIDLVRPSSLKEKWDRCAGSIAGDALTVPAARAKGDPSRIVKGGTRSETISFDALLQPASDLVPVDIRPDDPAVLQSTSGSSGKARFVELTHGNVAANVAQAAQCFDWLDLMRTDECETMLIFLPPGHSFPFSMTMFALTTGSRLVTITDPYDMEKIDACVEQYGVTMIPTVPTHMKKSLQSPHTGSHSWGTVKALIPGGMPLPEDVREGFENATGLHGRILEGYGQSEASPVIACNRNPEDNAPGTIGRPLPGTKVKIMAPDDPVRIVCTGVPGLLLVQGPQVGKGYYKDPQATEGTFLPGGWLRTGDIAAIDKKGRISIDGRDSRVVKVNSNRVQAEEVEEALIRHPHIAEAVAFGVPHAASGETVCAVIRLEENGARAILGDQAESMPREQRERALARSISASLAGILDDRAIPTRFEFTDREIPKLAIGKPNWKEVQEKYRSAQPSAAAPSP